MTNCYVDLVKYSIGIEAILDSSGFKRVFPIVSEKCHPIKHYTEWL